MGHSLVLHPTSQSQAGTQNGKFPIVNIFCLSIEILDSYRRKTEFPNFICFPSKKLSISRCRINNLFTPLCLSFFLTSRFSFVLKHSICGHTMWDRSSLGQKIVLTVACFCTYLEEPPLWATHLDIWKILTALPVKKKHIQRSREVYCIHLFYR